MTTQPNLRKLAVLAFARAGARWEGVEPRALFDRLESTPSASNGFESTNAHGVQVQVQGAMRANRAGALEPWLHLAAQAHLSLVCQRCLSPMEQEISVARDFRFVASEAQAESEDEVSEEDVLALSKDFDLLSLVEDELLMALPASPMHAACPHPVQLQVADADFAQAEEKPHPFAALAAFKRPPSHKP